MRCLTILAVSLLSIAHARVNFQYSTVLQAPDIAGTNKVLFTCKNVCKAYTDRISDKLRITKQNGDIVVTFSTIVNAKAAFPTGFLLQAGDYNLENRGEVNPEFVFYVVDSAAPNYGASVVVPQANAGVAIKDAARYVTVLSSFEAMWFSSFAGAFPTGYPRVYTAPYDAMGGNDCGAVYKARSQYNAEMSWPTIASAVFTVDFGFVGAHNASVNYGKIKDMTKTAGMTTVYTSPGYVGCTSTAGQNYYSKLNQVQDTFSIQAESLDVEAVYSRLTVPEPVTLTINGKLTNLNQDGSYNDHFDKGKMDVSILWTRQTPGSSFTIQLDFGNGADPNSPKTSQQPVVSTTSIMPTTSGQSGALLSFSGLALLIASYLW